MFQNIKLILQQTVSVLAYLVSENLDTYPRRLTSRIMLPKVNRGSDYTEFKHLWNF